MSEEYHIEPIHFKLQVWAQRKDDGLFPAMILSSISFNFEQIKEFEPEGKIQQAYKAYKDFCERNNPKLTWVTEEPKE
jgi:hypothetical protein